MQIQAWQKLIVFLIIISISLIFPLHIAKAISGWLIVLKEYVLDLIARLIARTLLSIMSNTILNRIATAGRFGGPAFVQDWRDFLEQGQYRGEDTFRAILADAALSPNATVCPFLRQPLATSFNVKPGGVGTGQSEFNACVNQCVGFQGCITPRGGTTPITQQDFDNCLAAARLTCVPTCQGQGLGTSPTSFVSSKYRVDAVQYYNLRNQCSLPTNFNLAAFSNNFSQGGGWSAWQKLIQPQNNIYGTYADSFRELVTQRGFEEGIDKSEAESGSGYTSKRQDGIQAGCTGVGPNKQCLILGKVVTPADLFGKTGASTIDKELDWLTDSDEIAEVIVAVAGALVNRLTNFVMGVIPGPTTPKNLGDDTSQAPANAPGQASQDCINACIAANCNEPALPACRDDDGDGVSDNRPCDPDDPDPNAACIANCQAQGCR